MPGITDPTLYTLANQIKYAKRCRDQEEVDRLCSEREEYKKRRGVPTTERPAPASTTEKTTASQVSRRTGTHSASVSHGLRESTERKQEAIVETRSETRELNGKVSVENISTVINRETLTRKQKAWKECIIEVTTVNQEIAERGVHLTKKLILSIQNNPRSDDRQKIMHAIKIESNKKLSECPPGLWPITDRHSPEEKARREKLNIKIRQQTDEWNELQKTHRYVVHDLGEQHDDCNRDQLEGQSLAEIAKSGNVFAKRLMSLTSDDPIVKEFYSVKKFTVNTDNDCMFGARIILDEIVNDFIGVSDKQFVGDLSSGPYELAGIKSQVSLDKLVSEHLDGGSIPPNRVGVVMKTFAASIYSRLQGGDPDGAADMMQRAQKAWKWATPYYSTYKFGFGGVQVAQPTKSPLLELISHIDPEWRSFNGSENVETVDMLMNGQWGYGRF